MPLEELTVNPLFPGTSLHEDIPILERSIEQIPQQKTDPGIKTRIGNFASIII
jgi:hypothetical protein